MLKSFENRPLISEINAVDVKIVKNDDHEATCMLCTLVFFLAT